MQSTKKLGFACDHAGYDVKTALVEDLRSKGVEVIDFGTNSNDSVDYADYAHKLADAVEAKEVDFGISLCGSGNGINMTMNKHAAVRSALCWEKEIAMLARSHNDANVCTIPARYVSVEEAKEILATFLNTEFEGGRHQQRIDKIPLCR